MSNGNSALKWIAIGCGAFLLLGLCAGGAVAIAATTIWKATDAPVLAARGFFTDLRAGDYESARQRTDAVYQSSHDAAALQASVQQHPALVVQTDVTFTSRSIQPDTATLSGNLSTPDGDAPVTVTMSKAGEHWYISSVTVQGRALQ